MFIVLILNMYQLTRNVPTGSGGADDGDGVSDILRHLEVAVDEVADLDEDPGPVDAVDGAQVVPRHVLRVSEHGLDGDIKIIRGSVNSVAVNIVIWNKYFNCVYKLFSCLHLT